MAAYFSGSAFSTVSGDIVIASTGVATIQANSVALTTDTTGNYVATLTGGTGITSTGATSGEGIAHSISVDASQTQITAVGTIATGVWQGTDVGVAYGGTGVSSLTDGGVLLGSGTDAITAMAVLTDGQMIVGDGSTDPVAESGATLRTSIGVGTTDNVLFAAISASGDISGSATSTGSFGSVVAGGTGFNTFNGKVGIGTTAPDNTLHVAGNTHISSSSAIGSSTASLHIEGSGSLVVAVDGTQGRLFSITDEMSGSIFSANTIAGLPVIEAFSNNQVNLGPFSSPIQIDASGNISGSVTSTGSFGAVYVAGMSIPNLADFSSSIQSRLTTEEADADFTAAGISGSWRGELSSSAITYVGGGVSGSSVVV